VEKEGSSQGYVYRVNLFSGDFEPGKKAVIEYRVGFADMPETYLLSTTPSAVNISWRAGENLPARCQKLSARL
jgi:hypothetical protein